MNINNPIPKNEFIKSDIVIAGAGLSGLSAALTAIENGLTVTLLEKMNFTGGAGLLPEGSLGIGSGYQKKKGIETTVNDVFLRVMEFHHWRCNAPVIRTLLSESGRTIDWLMEKGVRIEGIKTLFPPEKSLNVWHIFKGGGAKVVKILSNKIKKYWGTILTETPAKEILTDDSGQITGITAETKEGKKIHIMAHAVILSTGGFASNRQMLKKYVPDINIPGMARLIYRGPEIDGRMGDGINMALRVNAQLSGMGAIAGNSPYLDHEPAINQFRGPDYLKQTRCALIQPYLWVNKQGERFYNESLGSIFSDVYNAMTSNGGIMWSIFDEKMKRSLIENGPLIPFNDIVVPGDKMDALDEGIIKGIEEGFAYRADTIEELAKKIHIRPEKLKTIIDKVNTFSDLKSDPEFNRRPEHLIKFDTANGPYYALKGLRAFFLTLGGVKVNREMQALDTNDEPIPHLHVTGQDMGGLYDSTYDLLIEGSASSFALSSGRLAVKAIIRDLR
ncbi:MAG: FAD-binding protein [Deltaproteobacteria bacterium]|nr:FAD-binding protein [Deltaproteobacteria bacterium]